jgi:hypothetical protein
MAPGARLVVQDGGYAGPDDPCGDLPGLGCAPSGLEAILDEAYAQGARIHSDSWSDDSAGPPPANSGYSMSARDVDDFVFRHPDFLPFFVAGNTGASGPSSVPSPGNGKNSVCVGSTRNFPTGSDDDLSDFSGIGPAADGRIKPDLVAPGYNVSASSDFSIATDNARPRSAPDRSRRQRPPSRGARPRIFRSRRLSVGCPRDPAASSPSAALLKAALIASGTPGRRPVSPWPPPSSQQGFGRNNFAGPRLPRIALPAPRRDRIAAFTTGSEAAVFPITVRWPELCSA